MHPSKSLANSLLALQEEKHTKRICSCVAGPKLHRVHVPCIAGILLAKFELHGRTPVRSCQQNARTRGDIESFQAALVPASLCGSWPAISAYSYAAMSSLAPASPQPAIFTSTQR